MPQYLDVPFSEKDQAKALGARWDGQTKQWFVPDGIPVQPFQKWLPQTPELHSRLIAPLYLRTSYERCWRCSEVSRVYCLGATAINDVQRDDDGEPFSSLIDNEDGLVDVCDLDHIDQRLLPVLKKYAPTYHPDFSKTKNAKCWMNHCEHCGAKLGDFFLHNEPGGAFCPISDEESTITDTLLFEDGEFFFDGGFGLKG